MNIIKLFDSFSDAELTHKLMGKTICVRESDNDRIKGLVTGFINSALSGDSSRRIVGIRINNDTEIVITDLIKEITING